MTFFSTKDGRAILPLGLQTHNSSTGVPEMLEREIKAVKHFGGNLLEAPVYWFRIEAEEGVYNFDDVDDLILRCRAHGLQQPASADLCGGKRRGTEEAGFCLSLHL